MKTLEFLKELTGYDFAKENTNNYILRQIRNMLGLRRQIEDDEAFEFLSSFSFIKKTIDKSKDPDYLFDHMDCFYAEKDEYKIIIRCDVSKNGIKSGSLKWSNFCIGRVEGETAFLLKYYNLDIVKEYHKAESENDLQEEIKEPVETTTIKELAKKLNISDRDLGWSMLDIIKSQQISNDCCIIRFERVNPQDKGSKAKIIVKEVIKRINNDE